MKAIFFAIVKSLNAKIFRILTPLANKLLHRLWKADLTYGILKAQRTLQSDLAWWVPIPHIHGPSALVKPYVLSYWDSFTFEYSTYFTYLEKDYTHMKQALQNSKCVLTQSKSNALKLESLYNIPREKVYTSSLKSTLSIDDNDIMPITNLEDGMAGRIHKSVENYYSAKKDKEGISEYEYMDTWSFFQLTLNSKISERMLSKNPFFVVSTQNRPYKNLAEAFKLLSSLHQEGIPISLVLTAGLDYHNLCNLASKKMIDRYHNWIYSFSSISDRHLASLYANASFSFHPSIAEGGSISYPFMESVSLGTPSFMLLEPFTQEMLSLTRTNQSLWRKYMCLSSQELINLSKQAVLDKTTLIKEQELLLREYNDLASSPSYSESLIECARANKSTQQKSDKNNPQHE